MAVGKQRSDIVELADDLQRANYAISVRRYDLAIEIMQRMLSEFPENSVAFYTLGRAYILKKQYIQAIDVFQETLRLEPTNSLAHTLYGWTLHLIGQHERGEAEARSGVELDPANSYPYYIYALILLERRKNMAAAREQCSRALEMKPEDAKYHWLLGRICAQEGLIEQAEIAYRQALSIDPEDAFIHCSYGVLLLNQKRQPREAYEHFRIALMAAPDNADIKRNFFIALKAKHKFYWLSWHYGLLLKKLGRARILFFVVPLVLVQIVRLLPENNVTMPILLVVICLLLIFYLYMYTVNSLFDFLIKRGWVK